MKLRLTILAILLYVVACLLPAYSLQGATAVAQGRTAVIGYECLFSGMLAILGGYLQAFYAWLANIPFLIALVAYFFRWKGIWILALQVLGIFLSFSALGVREFPLNENGLVAPTMPSFGLFLWIASMGVLLWSSFIKTKPKATAEPSK